MQLLCQTSTDYKLSYGIIPQSYLSFMDSFAMDSIIKTVRLSIKLWSSLELQICYQCLDPAGRNSQFFEKITKFGHKEQSFSAFHSEIDI